MIEIQISKETIDLAEKLTDKKPYNNKSFLKGEGNFIGKLGDILLYNYLTPYTSYDDKFNHDHLVKSTGETIELKTKSQNYPYPPKPDFEASVAETSTHQKPDYLVFFRIHTDLKKAWIMGYLPRSEYYKKARFLKKGTKDGNNNYTVKANCYNVKYGELKPIKHLYNKLAK